MEGIAHLYKLRVLNLSENGISKLECVFDLKLLEVLDISSNYLSEMVPL
jgi:Leucine-rich repeat (LRR) protein